MQVLVCEDEIAWRERARRILVFSSDADFNYAGDGKLKPNDGQCHMSGNQYTNSAIQDYPTISQINQKVNENAINIVFAVTPQQYSVYRNLSEQIDGSSAAILAEDSSNVIELIREEYNVSKTLA
jgi:integrin beta 1